MQYKCISESDRDRKIDTFRKIIDDENHMPLYYPSWLKTNLQNMDREKIPRILGALYGNTRLEITQKNLEQLNAFIRYYNIYEFLEPKDVDLLIYFSKNPKFERTLKPAADSILSVLFIYPEEVQIKLYEAGIFNDMVNNFMKPQWINGLALYANNSHENRDKLFEIGIPQKILNNSIFVPDEENIVQKYDYLDFISFVDALCSFPLSNEEQFSILSQIFIQLNNLLRCSELSIENSILKAFTKFAILDPNCLNVFAEFHVCDYFSQQYDSYDSKNMIILSIMILNIINYSPDYARAIIFNENVWQIVINIIISVHKDLLVYRRPATIMSNVGIILAGVAPDYFINKKIFAVFEENYESYPFEIKSNINIMFFVALSNSNTELISNFMEGCQNFLNIVFDYFPVPDNQFYLSSITGLLKLIEFLESKGDEGVTIIHENILQSEEFGSWLLRCFEDPDEINSYPEDLKELTILLASKLYSYMQNIERE
ncbi:hypothetical protein TRFO_04436 [Tritrichomonas foetus]|uniref:Uncharacterized protein n=1 Tax=Tritrichomonas foetus TaxID=1144522 RepID=A0A1J4KFT9_9EUKA|nr:hypothetical protein TRFO_04436 [Tritrichomonas foetus]|eukprot:OHT09890.1 hypothetical protein TRFO_04436 [Tritrichomonas foetus]